MGQSNAELQFGECARSQEGSISVKKNVCAAVPKSTQIVLPEKNRGYVFDIDRRDLELWMNEPFPVVLILYDATRDTGFSVEIHLYFLQKGKFEGGNRKFVRVFIPAENVLNPNPSNPIASKKINFMLDYTVYKNIQVTYGELEQVLTQLHFTKKRGK